MFIRETRVGQLSSADALFTLSSGRPRLRDLRLLELEGRADAQQTRLFDVIITDETRNVPTFVVSAALLNKWLSG